MGSRWRASEWSEDDRSAERIRVFLVDDHPATLNGLRMMLDAPDIEITGQAETGRDAVAKVLSVCPRVLILDVRLPDIGGLEVMKADQGSLA